MLPPALLQQPGCAEQLWPLTIDAYRALGEAGLIPRETELLYGFVFKKMSKSPLHRVLILRLLRLIRAAADLATQEVMSEQPITCGDSEPEPDVAVVSASEAASLESHPKTALLVVEVAVTSGDYDRSKAAAYAGANVAEFWIVEPNDLSIEVLSKPSGGQYAQRERHGIGSVIESESVPRLKIDVAALFAK